MEDTTARQHGAPHVATAADVAPLLGSTSHSLNVHHGTASLFTPSTTHVSPALSARPAAADTAPFDILLALDNVATRPEPQYALDGPLKSQAFVVTDGSLPDMPVVYVSESFWDLTGYHPYEVIGRNMRFLQSPDGIVHAGAARKHISSAAAYYLKQMVAAAKEAQHIIINFKKNQQPFSNLLTIIPLFGDAGAETQYMFGFLTEVYLPQPSLTPLALPSQLNNGSSAEMMRKRRSLADLEHEMMDLDSKISVKSSSLNTSQAAFPVPVIGLSPHRHPLELLEQLGGYNPSLAQTTIWNKTLLDNIDGVAMVVSLKGTIVYASPSHQQFGYSEADLLGNSFENIWHPSDAISVLRQLKSATLGEPLDFMSRIKEQPDRYIWMHSYGSILQDSGRRWAVLVGRQQSMFRLSRDSIHAMGDRDLWVKLSTSGFVLNAFPNSMTALGVLSEDFIGTSFHNLAHDRDSAREFQHILSRAGQGHISSATIKLRSARNHNLNVEVTIYPGDMLCRKPYFFWVQCRFLRPPSRKTSTSMATSASLGSNISMQYQDLPLLRDTSGALVLAPAVAVTATASSSKVINISNSVTHDFEPDNSGVWQYELHQLARSNTALKDELQKLTKRLKHRQHSHMVASSTARSMGVALLRCSNCHTQETPEWRRGPSGFRDLCNRCGLRWAKSVRKAPKS
ncbi:hypothetical protein BX600DRAFT_467926 [Xylariales sp. PMI_506]|nr:hypothetical protein BX600DRAFT_467926 [Xylariales sp. PMI_506]